MATINQTTDSEAIIQRLLEQGHITVSEALTLLRDISAPKYVPQCPPMEPYVPVYPNTPNIGKEEDPFRPPYRIYCNGKGTQFKPGNVTTAPGTEFIDEFRTRID